MIATRKEPHTEDVLQDTTSTINDDESDVDKWEGLPRSFDRLLPM